MTLPRIAGGSIKSAPLELIEGSDESTDVEEIDEVVVQVEVTQSESVEVAAQLSANSKDSLDIPRWRREEL